MLKNIIRKCEKKNNNDVKTNMAQLERSNNKCYASAFKCIQVKIRY